MMRESGIERKTAETDIKLALNIDGSGAYHIDTGVGFFNHMLELFTKHSGFSLNVTCTGDTCVDFHHTVEDIGILLGRAVSEALGDRRGIARYGNIILPMDETLILAAVDFGGRAYLGYDVSFPTEKVGAFDTELVREFLLAFTREAKCSVHIKQLAGSNSHHIAEGIFKAFARTLRQAGAIDDRQAGEIPSTKGVLD